MENKPYVFISYAHLDSDKVFPCLQEMRRSNINLWYDEGIQAGSEWPEFIAEKVVNCDKFVLFVSKAYLESQNCKRELNFAISRKKAILSVFLEDVNLSPGMEMQLGTYQALYKNRFNSVSAFHNSICVEQFFDSCRTVKPAPKPEVQAEAPVYTEPAVVDSVYNSILNAPNSETAAPGKVQKKKRRITAAVLAILLGSFGAHKFYLKKYVWGIVYLLMCQIYVSAILGIIEGILLLRMSDEEFDKKYNRAV